MSRVVQVRDVPDHVHEALQREAARRGLSLTQFLLQEYDAIARRSRNYDVLRRASERSGRRSTAQDIVDDVREARERGR